MQAPYPLHAEGMGVSSRGWSAATPPVRRETPSQSEGLLVTRMFNGPSSRPSRTPGIWYPLSVPLLRRHHGRKRIILGRTLLTASLLVAAAWVASRWWGAALYWRKSTFFVNRGVCSYRHTSQIDPTSLKVNPLDDPMWYWWFAWKYTEILPSEVYDYHWRSRQFGLGLHRNDTFPTYHYWSLSLVFWPLPLLLLALGVPVLQSGVIARRRARTGVCRACGYDRRGIAADRPCPECGAA